MPRPLMLHRGLVAASVGWAIALPAATFVVAHPLPALYALAFGVYAVGSFVCHQLPQRSFNLWMVQMPVCARCTGIYVGAAVAAMVRRDRATRRVRLLLALAAVPTLVSLVDEWTTGETPANWIRAVAALPLGAAVATLVVGRTLSGPPFRKVN
jgi:uncharacterized membrane protein